MSVSIIYLILVTEIPEITGFLHLFTGFSPVSPQTKHDPRLPNNGRKRKARIVLCFVSLLN